MDGILPRLSQTGLLLLLLGACAEEQATPPTRGAAASTTAGEAGLQAPRPLTTGELFVDASARAGLDFVHDNGMAGSFYMVENMGAGGAFLDFDGDGDLDLYLVQGGPLEGAMGGRDRLYRNDLDAASGSPRFVDVSDAAGELADGYGMGVAAGDFDGDGWTDLYVTQFGADRLLRNRGDGTFEDVTRHAGLGDERWNVPALFADFDADGDLDLYTGSYVDFTLETHRPCTTKAGVPDYCDPVVYAALPDRLYRNRGDTTFEDVSRRAGLGDAMGKALGAAAADFDGDGRLDLYVANDGTPNHLWLNQGPGEEGVMRFVDDAPLAGCAVNADGAAEASMGVGVADADGDGDLDLFLSHLTAETHTLYRNDGAGNFDDVTVAAGLGRASLEATGFGAGWLDGDGDGRLDLAVVNGAVRSLEHLAQRGDPYPYHQPNQLFLAAADGRYEDASPRAGTGFTVSEVSRGLIFGDVDNDGDVDLVVTNNQGPARLLLNQRPRDVPWLGLELVVGEEGRERDAPGAKAAIHRPGRAPRWGHVRVDGSYASASDPRLTFALGDGSEIGEVRVVWPGGAVEAWHGLELGRYTTLRRGTGEPVE